jgi:hypothetical protein
LPPSSLRGIGDEKQRGKAQICHSKAFSGEITPAKSA